MTALVFKVGLPRSGSRGLVNLSMPPVLNLS